jgi:hypothetical protein
MGITSNNRLKRQAVWSASGQTRRFADVNHCQRKTTALAVKLSSSVNFDGVKPAVFAQGRQLSFD